MALAVSCSFSAGEPAQNRHTKNIQGAVRAVYGVDFRLSKSGVTLPATRFPSSASTAWMWVTCWFSVTAGSHSGRVVHSNVIEMGLSGSPLTTCDGFLSHGSVKYVIAAMEMRGVFIQQMLAPEFDLIDGGESGQRDGFRRCIDFVQCVFRSCHKKS